MRREGETKRHMPKARQKALPVNVFEVESIEVFSGAADNTAKANPPEKEGEPQENICVVGVREVCWLGKAVASRKVVRFLAKRCLWHHEEPLVKIVDVPQRESCVSGVIAEITLFDMELALWMKEYYLVGVPSCSRALVVWANHCWKSRKARDEHDKVNVMQVREEEMFVFEEKGGGDGDASSTIKVRNRRLVLGSTCFVDRSEVFKRHGVFTRRVEGGDSVVEEGVRIECWERAKRVLGEDCAGVRAVDKKAGDSIGEAIHATQIFTERRERERGEHEYHTEMESKRWGADVVSMVDEGE